MYLTKLLLNLRSAQARRDLGDAYEMHRTLARVFAFGPQSSLPRFLWRLEMKTESLQSPVVLIQAQEQGDWSVVNRMPDYLQSLAETKKVDLCHLVRLDRQYRFRLLANPTVCRQGKRLALLKLEEQTAWIERQGTSHGFEVKAMIVSPHELLNSSREEKAPICVHRVCFEGKLCIRDKVAFERALLAGIGPAKAFGCGLLSVAPC